MQKVRAITGRKLHIALSGPELRTLGEALRWASTECAARAAGHRASAEYTELPRYMGDPDMGALIVADGYDEERRRYDALLRRVAAAASDAGMGGGAPDVG